MHQWRSAPLGRVLVFALVRLLAASLVATLAAPAAALPVYEIVPLGFTDAEHTRSDGYQSSFGGGLTESGYGVGVSTRFSGGAISLGGSAWLYDAGAGTTTRLGYFDAAHTRNDGYQSSNTDFVTGSGYAVGFSERYTGSPAPSAGEPGQSSWLYDASAGTTTRLGFFDAAHTRDSGLQSSYASSVTESGYAVGGSALFNGGATYLGQSAWLYDASAVATTRLGYFDAAHTGTDGSQTSYADIVTESGYVVGTSSRYDGTAYRGASAWLYDSGAGTTTRLGYFDAAHTHADGSQRSYRLHLTESGYVIGNSLRYDGAVSRGSSAWFYDAGTGTTKRLGYFDAAHTRDDGYQGTEVNFLSESGYAAGSSNRYVGASSLGDSAWLYHADTDSTTRLGFFDAAHTRNDGRQASDVDFVTASGYAAGTSTRYDGATFQGFSAWLHDSSTGTTARLGLFDTAHTRNDGFQQSDVDFVTESGYTAGVSLRYSGGATSLGRSTWLYDAGTGTTTRLGLFDAAHTRSDGLQDSYTRFVTESGYASGGSARYNGGATDLGESAWIYRASDQSQDIILLSERSDGYARSHVLFLGEDGLALGLYELFDADDTFLGNRAFAWTSDDGALDLGALVAGGLTAEGWQQLAVAFHANGVGQIVGSGRLQSGGDLAYLLVPIPEAGTGLLVSVGMIGLVARQRRAQRDAA